MDVPKEVQPVGLENGDEDQGLRLSEVAAREATSRATQLLAGSRPPVWFGTVVELGDGSIDYSLGNATRDH